jgi:hypothetical protein
MPRLHQANWPSPLPRLRRANFEPPDFNHAREINFAEETKVGGFSQAQRGSVVAFGVIF